MQERRCRQIALLKHFCVMRVLYSSIFGLSIASLPETGNPLVVTLSPCRALFSSTSHLRYDVRDDLRRIPLHGASVANAAEGAYSFGPECTADKGALRCLQKLRFPINGP